MNRRVQSGLFVTKAPYGYKNIRINGRGAVQIDPVNGPKVQRIFDLYGNGFHTLDTLADALIEEGIEYIPSVKKVPRSKLHTILTDRSYLGELRHHKAWLAQSLSQWTRWLLTRGNLSYYISRATCRGLITGGKLSYSISK